MFERAAGARAHDRSKFGFFVFSHARVRPLTYHEPIRFKMMPSPQPAGMAERGGAVAGERLAELDAFPRSLNLA
jgi:hypothetical protein